MAQATGATPAVYLYWPSDVDTWVVLEYLVYPHVVACGRRGLAVFTANHLKGAGKRTKHERTGGSSFLNQSHSIFIPQVRIVHHTGALCENAANSPFGFRHQSKPAVALWVSSHTYDLPTVSIHNNLVIVQNKVCLSTPPPFKY